MKEVIEKVPDAYDILQNSTKESTPHSGSRLIWKIHNTTVRKIKKTPKVLDTKIILGSKQIQNIMTAK